MNSRLMCWIRVFWIEAVLSYNGRFAITSPFGYLAGKMGWPLFLMLFFIFMGKFVGFANPAFIMIGNMLLIPASSGMGGVTLAVGEERQWGTLSYVLGSPAPRMPVFLGRAFFYIIDGFVTMLLGLFITAAIFGLNLTKVNLLLLLFCSLLIAITSCGVGFLFGSLSLVSRDAWVMLSTFLEVLYILAGVNIPIISLPAIMQKISFAIPLTRGIMAARLVMDGGNWSAIQSLVAGEVLVGGLYILAGYLLFRIIEKRSFISGTLDAM
jgi:ABC-2 type transport system permease protein